MTAETTGTDSETLARTRYWSGLDGLRAFAVLSVMAFHLNRPEAAGGFLGVDVFFVLSGFLITDLLLRERLRTGTISLRRFFGRRALRLFPALGALLIAALALALMWPSQAWSPWTLRGLPFVAGYVGNWYRAAGSEETLGLLVHTWSLAIEEQFYLLWPLVVLGLARAGLRRRHVTPLLVAAAVSVAVWRLLLAHYGHGELRLTSGLDTHADGLLLGAAVAYLLAGDLALRPWPRRGLAAATWTAAGLLLALTVALPADSSATRYGYAAAAVATAVVVAGLATRAVPLLTRALEVAPLTWVGRRSYGIYLCHFPIFLIIAGRTIGGLPGTVVAVPLTFAIAALSFRYLEQPALRLRTRLG